MGLGDLPEQQFLAPEVVLLEMGATGAKRAISLSTLQVLILSVMARPHRPEPIAPVVTQF